MLESGRQFPEATSFPKKVVMGSIFFVSKQIYCLETFPRYNMIY